MGPEFMHRSENIPTFFSCQSQCPYTSMHAQHVGVFVQRVSTPPMQIHSSFSLHIIDSPQRSLYQWCKVVLQDGA